MIPVQQERIVLPVQPVLLIRSASTSPKSKTPPESIHSTWVKGHPGQTLLDNFYFACAPLNFCVKVNSSASNCSYIWTSAYRSFMAIQAIVYNFKYHWSLWGSSAADMKIPHCVLQFEVDEEKRIMYKSLYWKVPVAQSQQIIQTDICKMQFVLIDVISCISLDFFRVIFDWFGVIWLDLLNCEGLLAIFACISKRNCVSTIEY